VRKRRGKRYLNKPAPVQVVTDSIDHLASNNESVSNFTVDNHIQITLAVSGFLQIYVTQCDLRDLAPAFFFYLQKVMPLGSTCRSEEFPSTGVFVTISTFVARIEYHLFK
jgi:hypothetical protein